MQGVQIHALLKYFSPSLVAIYGACVFGIIYIVAPIVVVDGESAGALEFCIICYLAFFVGCSLAQTGAVSSAPRSKPGQIETLFRVVSALALAGAAARTIDRFYLRGLSLGMSIFENREAALASGSSLVSFVALPLSCLSFLVPYLYFSQNRSSRKLAILPFVLLIACFPGFDSLMLGSRSVIIVSVLLYCMFAFFLGAIRFDLKSLFLLIVVSLVLVFFGISIFVQRLDEMGFDIARTIHFSSYALTVQPNSYVDFILSANTGEFATYPIFGVLHISQYYLHGLFEFGFLYENFDGHHLYGAYTFHPIYRVFASFFGWPTYDELVGTTGLRVGAYTTFFGPIFVDFGWSGSIALMAVFGFLTQRLWVLASTSALVAIPLYSYCILVIFFAPVDNLLADAQGLINVAALGGYALLAYSLDVGKYASAASRAKKMESLIMGDIGSNETDKRPAAGTVMLSFESRIRSAINVVRYFRLIVVFAALLGALLGIYIAGRTPRYESIAQVPVFKGRPANYTVALVQTDQLIDRVLQESPTYVEDSGSFAAAKLNFRWAFRAVGRDADFVTLSFQAQTPESARQMLQKIISTYITNSIPNGVEAQNLNDQMRFRVEAISQLQKWMNETAIANATVSPSDDPKMLRGIIEGVRTIVIFQDEVLNLKKVLAGEDLFGTKPLTDVASLPTSPLAPKYLQFGSAFAVVFATLWLLISFIAGLIFGEASVV